MDYLTDLELLADYDASLSRILNHNENSDDFRRMILSRLELEHRGIV